MPYMPPPSLDGLSLAEIAGLVADDRLPPVASWTPERSGDSAMRIAADGSWTHEGGAINRPAMIRAFASLLRRDADGHWLVTPQEKLAIAVEDAPLMMVEQRVEGSGRDARRAVRLNTDRLVMIDAAHPLLWAAGRERLPYCDTGDGLLARPSRGLWDEWAAEALDTVEQGLADTPGLWSAGQFFTFESVA